MQRHTSMTTLTKREYDAFMVISKQLCYNINIF